MTHGNVRAIDIDDAVIEASRIYREALTRRYRAIHDAQKGEAFKEQE